MIETKQELRAWAERMRLTPTMAARVLRLAQAGYNAKLYGTRPIDPRTSLLAAVYEAVPDVVEQILVSTEAQATSV
jgi:hypothetical protein